MMTILSTHLGLFYLILYNKRVKIHNSTIWCQEAQIPIWILFFLNVLPQVPRDFFYTTVTSGSLIIDLNLHPRLFEIASWQCLCVVHSHDRVLVYVVEMVYVCCGESTVGIFKHCILLHTDLGEI